MLSGIEGHPGPQVGQPAGLYLFEQKDRDDGPGGHGDHPADRGQGGAGGPTAPGDADGKEDSWRPADRQVPACLEGKNRSPLTKKTGPAAS